MKTRLLRLISMGFAVASLSAAQSVPLTAQEEPHTQRLRYKLFDLGTFGGPASFFNTQLDDLNSHGVSVGASQTPVPDPPNSNGYPCGPGTFVYHAFESHNGVMTDLGALPGANKCSNAQTINELGEVAGNSENDEIDPFLGLYQIRAVVWKNRRIIDLGTLGGNESAAFTINNRGQVVGWATNDIPDPYSFYGAGSQVRAFLWEKGMMRDLGTLGGPDSQAIFLNDRGQVAGDSYINFTPNPDSGVPTSDPFLWENGKMLDLGTLGGTSGQPNWLNRRGQVAGTSNLAGDFTNHPFLWDRGVLIDLGTFGGSNGQALWVNDAGEVVGEADLPGDQVHDAFLWKNGVMTDLGNLGQTSFGYAINSKSQVVGHSQTNDGDYHAFIWQKSGGMVDLNTLIPSNSSLVLRDAYNINDSGVIAGVGLPAGCDDSDTCGHAYVLTPCGGSGDGSDAAPCPTESDLAQRTPPSTVPAPIARSVAAKSATAQLRARMAGYSNPRLRGR
jgi:probable HAF family extracellular repeat protein